MRFYLSICFVLCICAHVFFNQAFAGVKDHYTAEVEIYGRAAFLIRITEQTPFATSVHSHAEAECMIPDDDIRKAVLKVLKQNNRPIAEEDSSAHFTIHAEYFGGKDDAGHCQVGFDVALLKRHAGFDKGAELIEKQFDYVNSVHLMKISGLVHADEAHIPELMDRQVQELTNTLLQALSKIHLIYKDKQN